MWGGLAGLVFQFIAGAVGGSVIGTTVKRYDLGMIGNLLVGISGRRRVGRDYRSGQREHRRTEARVRICCCFF